MTTTLIKNADWIVAWDAVGSRHVYMTGADVAFADGRITYVGREYVHTSADELEVISGQGKMIMPGLVNIHSHLAHEPINKGYTDETGSAGLYNSNLYEYMPTMEGDEEAASAQLTLGAAELLMSGVTTVVDISIAHEQWFDIIVKSGMRGYFAPMFRSARWFTRNGHLVEYDWDEQKGMNGMERALQLIERARTHPSGRLTGMVVPAQIDTCSAELIKTSHAEAVRRGLPWQIHAGQSISEFHEITRRHGVTPIQWLHKLGVLDPGSIIGHAIFVDDHPNTHWSTTRDLSILAETRASIAHCPTVFMRRGMALRDFGRYRRAGINIGLGTDTYPHNMIEEMRHVGYLGRLMAQSPRALSSGDVFNAATVGGAKALGREDIGRLAVGAKADIVLVDMNHHLMQPSRDPIRSLIYAAADRAVHTVFVDGHEVLHGGEVTQLDYRSAAAKVNEAQQRAEALVPERDLVSHRSAREMSPLTFDIV